MQNFLAFVNRQNILDVVAIYAFAITAVTTIVESDNVVAVIILFLFLLLLSVLMPLSSELMILHEIQMLQK